MSPQRFDTTPDHDDDVRESSERHSDLSGGAEGFAGLDHRITRGLSQALFSSVFA